MTALRPRARVDVEIRFTDGAVKKVPMTCQIDTAEEMDYFRNGGILQYVLRGLAA